MKILLSTLILIAAPAQAETIRFHGLEFEAAEIEYFLGTDKIHSFRAVEPVAFPFARENIFPAEDKVYLRENGTISMIVSTAAEIVEWKLPGNRTLSMNCGRKRNNWGDMVPRMVSFHENGEYKRGCSATKPMEFSNSSGGTIEAQGDIDLNSDLSLAYSSSIIRGSLRMKGGEVSLKPGTEVAFHSASEPHFFTIDTGQNFSAHQGDYGETLFTQSAGRPVSTSLFPDGSVERGIIGQDFQFPELGILVPAGSGLAFTQQAGKLQIAIAILFSKVKINAVNNTFYGSRIGLNQEIGMYEVVVADTFTFKGADDLLMDIPPGSVVTLSRALEIISVRVPVKEAPFKRKQLGL